MCVLGHRGPLSPGNENFPIYTFHNWFNVHLNIFKMGDISLKNEFTKNTHLLLVPPPLENVVTRQENFVVTTDCSFDISASGDDSGKPLVQIRGINMTSKALFEMSLYATGQYFLYCYAVQLY